MSAEYSLRRMSLQSLLEGLIPIGKDMLVGEPSVYAQAIEPDGVFLAVAGSHSHGLAYADEAVRREASVIVYDPANEGEFLAEKVKKQFSVRLIKLPKLSQHVSEIAARFYHHPSKSMTVIGVTGTNGKTSVSHFLAQAMNEADNACGLIGTLGWGQLKEMQQTINTTPNAVAVQNQLASMADDGIKNVAMEVSSHGLDQGRVQAVEFKGAVFTNLTHDHLDYHQTMAAYGEAKLALFKCRSLMFVVLNNDDVFSEKIKSVIAPTCRVLTFSRSFSQSDACHDNSAVIANEKLNSNGLSFDLTLGQQTVSVQSALMGSFNIDNLVATALVLIAQGDSLEKAVDKIQCLDSVAGRMQVVPSTVEAPTVVIDYAHTPDALLLTLKSLRAHCQGSLSLVFGCGGDRDITKRPLMGAIAAQWADKVLISNDNPRTEPADQIAQQIMAGAPDAAHLYIELDRQRAIAKAIIEASNKDVVLIAGKGHEDYQQIGDEKTYFSDFKQAQENLKRRAVLAAGGLQ